MALGDDVLISQYLRQHYMAAVTAFNNPLRSFAPSGSAWTLQQGVVNRYGQVFTGGDGPQLNGVPLSALPANCQHLIMNGTDSLTKVNLHATVSCMQQSGFRGFVTYQPASRWWAFQGIETAFSSHSPPP